MITRSFQLALNKVSPTPNSLRANPAEDAPRNDVDIDISRLCHVMYFDCFNEWALGDEGTSLGRYRRFLTADREFRFKGDGMGANSDTKREENRRLGQAMCRLVLHDAFRVRYFAHIPEILDGRIVTTQRGHTVKRSANGDTPDYLCARSLNDLLVAEAKGTYKTVGFNTSRFDTWRKQFDRIRVVNSHDLSIATKGFIVATRAARQANPQVQPVIAIEDPKTPGGPPPDDSPDEGYEGLSVIAAHYSDVADGIGQDLVAYLLRRGETLGDKLPFEAEVWRCRVPPFEGKRFVGVHIQEQDMFHWTHRLWRRFHHTGTFVGLYVTTFQALCLAVRTGRRQLAEVNPPELGPLSAAPLAAMNDGTMSGPVRFFELDKIAEF